MRTYFIVASLLTFAAVNGQKNDKLDNFEGSCKLKHVYEEGNEFLNNGADDYDRCCKGDDPKKWCEDFNRNGKLTGELSEKDGDKDGNGDKDKDRGVGDDDDEGRGDRDGDGNGRDGRGSDDDDESRGDRSGKDDDDKENCKYRNNYDRGTKTLEEGAYDRCCNEEKYKDWCADFDTAGNLIGEEPTKGKKDDKDKKSKDDKKDNWRDNWACKDIMDEEGYGPFDRCDDDFGYTTCQYGIVNPDKDPCKQRCIMDSNDSTGSAEFKCELDSVKGFMQKMVRKHRCEKSANCFANQSREDNDGDGTRVGRDGDQEGDRIGRDLEGLENFLN